MTTREKERKIKNHLLNAKTGLKNCKNVKQQKRTFAMNASRMFTFFKSKLEHACSVSIRRMDLESASTSIT